MKGRPHVPLIMRADAYTIASDDFVSKSAKFNSVYNYTNRYSPADAVPEVASDSRMVFYGLTEFIRTHLTQPITKEDVDNAEAFMKRAHSFGGPLNFNRDVWDGIVEDHAGYLPISIKAIPEGSVYYPNQPVIEVENTVVGYGEIAAHIEALMVGMVSIASARATICRHWREKLLEMGCDENLINYYIHDFGMRASSCGEESELLGMAHLLCFDGTDTFNAAYRAWSDKCNSTTGTSIPALAHRIVQGYEDENECFEAIRKAAAKNGNVASYVADCYNFNAALNNLANMARENPNDTIVVRPDSGPFNSNISDIILTAKDNNLPNLRFIQGDSANPTKVADADAHVTVMTNDNMFNHGIFGVGGWLRNTPTRDLFSAAYKLCSITNPKFGRTTNVVKLSETPTKMSVPGKTVINPNTEMVELNVGQEDKRQEYYNNGRVSNMCLEDFSVKQKRCIEDFSLHKNLFPTDFGMNRTCLSEEIQEIQNEAFNKHKGK